MSSESDCTTMRCGRLRAGVYRFEPDTVPTDKASLYEGRCLVVQGAGGRLTSMTRAFGEVGYSTGYRTL